VRPPGSAFSDDELGRVLRDLGEHIAYPQEPDLTAAVRTRIQKSPKPPFWARWPEGRRAVAMALLVLVAVATGTLALSPAARRAVADWLGIGGIRIVHGDRAEAPVAEDLRLGERVSLVQAQDRVSYDVLRPSALEVGEPDEVYLDDVIPGGQVSLVYRPADGLPEAEETGVGLLFTQFRSQLDETLVKKVVPPQDVVEAVTVNGLPGYWVGGPHTLLYEDAEGNIREERSRLAANVLIWEQDGITLRLESALTRQEALRIAESVR
jgi:hypothetical protein